MRNRRVVAGCAAFAAGGVLLRQVQPQTFNRVYNFFGSMISIAYNGCLAFSGGVEITAVLLKDFAQFLKSDNSEEVPRSVMKLFQLLRSTECLRTCQGFISTGIDGFMESGMGQKMFEENPDKESAIDKIISALVSEPGQNLVALAVKMATKTTVETFSQSVDLKEHIKRQQIIQQILQWLNTPRAQQLVSHTATSAVQTGVTALINAPQPTTNPYDNLLSALAQPQHAEVMRQLLQALVREAITTSAIQFSNKQNNAFSPRTNSPLRDRRTLAIPDLQQIPQKQYYNGVYNRPSNDVICNGTYNVEIEKQSIPQQILQGLASIGKNQNAKDLLVSVAGEVTGSGIRSMLYSMFDIVKGRPEFGNESKQQQQQQQKFIVKSNGLSSATMMSMLMALFLHISMFPLPYVQQQL